MRFSASLLAVLLISSATVANAQVAVQQPVVGTTGVGTTVSVPDRGRIVLGGVQRGAAGRVSNGPFRSGTNTGVSHQSGSISATVWIHDHQEMDRLLLSQPTGRDSGVSLSPRAEHAARSLTNGSAAPSVKTTESDAGEATRYLKRGREAVTAGKIEVAKVYLRLAVDRGSTEAAQDLRRLPQRVVARVPAR